MILNKPELSACVDKAKVESFMDTIKTDEGSDQV